MTLETTASVRGGRRPWWSFLGELFRGSRCFVSPILLVNNINKVGQHNVAPLSRSHSQTRQLSKTDMTHDPISSLQRFEVPFFTSGKNLTSLEIRLLSRKASYRRPIGMLSAGRPSYRRHHDIGPGELKKMKILWNSDSNDSIFMFSLVIKTYQIHEGSKFAGM